jgi:hypothetical protein
METRLFKNLYQQGYCYHASPCPAKAEDAGLRDFYSQIYQTQARLAPMQRAYTKPYGDSDMKKSIITCLVMLGLSFAGMGALGFLVYFPVAPVLNLWFPPHGTWHGDWLWPTTIITGMMWSFSFLGAGFINVLLEKSGKTKQWQRRTIYTIILWLWALAVWGIALSGRVWE